MQLVNGFMTEWIWLCRHHLYLERMILNRFITSCGLYCPLDRTYLSVAGYLWTHGESSTSTDLWRLYFCFCFFTGHKVCCVLLDTVTDIQQGRPVWGFPCMFHVLNLGQQALTHYAAWPYRFLQHLKSAFSKHAFHDCFKAHYDHKQ